MWKIRYKKIDFHEVDLTNVSQIVYILMNETDFQNKTEGQRSPKNPHWATCNNAINSSN